MTACQLFAGITATELLRILLGRGRALAETWGLQYQAYWQKLLRTWRPLGDRNSLALALARRQLDRMRPSAGSTA